MKNRKNPVFLKLFSFCYGNLHYSFHPKVFFSFTCLHFLLFCRGSASSRSRKIGKWNGFYGWTKYVRWDAQIWEAFAESFATSVGRVSSENFFEFFENIDFEKKLEKRRRTVWGQTFGDVTFRNVTFGDGFLRMWHLGM